MIKEFEKKPDTIKALQFNGKNYDEFYGFVIEFEHVLKHNEVFIDFDRNISYKGATVEKNDWIVSTNNYFGRLLILTDEQFQEQYQSKNQNEELVLDGNTVVYDGFMENIIDYMEKKSSYLK